MAAIGQPAAGGADHRAARLGQDVGAEALVDALSDDGVPHAALEVEAVVWTHPALEDEARLRHVRVNCALLRKAGPELLLVADTIETEAELAELIAAVDADEAFVVRLRAEPDTLAERIIAREPPRWSGLAELVEHARAMAPVAAPTSS